MVDILKLLNSEPIGSFKSSIGELCCFPLSIKDLSMLDQALPGGLKDSALEDFVRAFMQLVCFPEDSLKGDKFKPDKSVLKQADVQRLTASDLESFAQIYVENNPCFCNKQEPKLAKDSEGNAVKTSYESEVECPRADGESCVSYLHRLTVVERSKRMDHLKNISKSFGNFSGGLAESLRKNLSHGEELKRTLGQLRPELSELGYSTGPKQPDYNLGEMQRNAEAIRRAPFDDLAERLDQLIDSSVEYSRFVIESNQIQAQVADEIKKSGDVSSTYSKVNLWLSGVVIIITAFGLAITAYSINQGSKQSESTRVFSQGALQTLSGDLRDLSDSIRRDNAESRSALDEQLEALREENSDLKADLKQLRKKVEAVQKNNN